MAHADLGTRVADGRSGASQPKSSRARAILLNLALVGISLAFCLAVAEATLRTMPALLPEEAALRLHWQDLKAFERQTSDGMTIADDELGYLYRPRFHGQLTRQDLDFEFVTDEHGFRNVDPWPPTADIVVVGDSMVFGYGVTREEAWPSRVEQALDGPRVLNLGLVGAAPQQYTGILRRFGLPLEPKLVVYTLFPGNDLDDARGFADWQAAGRPAPYALWKLGDRGAALSSGLEWVLGHSYLYALVRESVRNTHSPFANRTMTLADGSRLELAPTVLARAASHARADHPDLALVLRAVEEAHDACQKRGIKLLVLLMPTKERVYLPLLGEPAPELFQPLETELKRLEIPYIDPTAAMRAEAAAGRKLYFTVDGHPNAAGHEVLATAVAGYLRAHDGAAKSATGS